MDDILQLNQLYYPGDDLGYRYTKESTTFKVWSPGAQTMEVVIYEKWDDKEGKSTPMELGQQGVWKAVLTGDMKDSFYTYRVTINSIARETPDPYTIAATANGIKGMIIDLSETNPVGWQNHSIPRLKNAAKAIIYETHVRDFSIHSNSGMKHKGKYLAFTELNTKTPGGVSTGIDHLKGLGITHLHLLPVYDFQSIDERREDQYNWGYDPYLYNVPEGSYSTNPYDGKVRIREFKEMVKSLHENGIGVIMDVVYNHTYSTGDSPFDILVPQYYYRMTPEGKYSNGSGCGNETASQKPMVRKFILDSLKYWVREYKIDGFRFDLMALHDRDTMDIIEKELKELKKDIILYGEPWTGGDTVLEESQQFRKGSQQNMGIAVFNDNIRNAIKGDNDGEGWGFVQGARGMEEEIKKGIVGGIEYNQSIKDFTKHPIESINYVSSHDNLTLFDKIQKSNPNHSQHQRIAMNKLALAIVLTSQGIPFIQGGTELLRTKLGNHNSYNAGDKVNQIDWDIKESCIDYFNYIKGLIELRKSQQVFTLTTDEEVRKNLTFIDSPQGTLAFRLNSTLEGDWKDILVIYNSNHQEAVIDLPLGEGWRVVVNDKKSGITPLEDDSLQGDKLIAKAISAYVLYRK